MVAEAGYDSAYTFIYSPRPGTEAAARTDEFVPPEVVAERFDRLRVVVERSALARHQARVGRIEEVLVEGPSKRDPRVRQRPDRPRASWSTSRRRPGMPPGRDLGRRAHHPGRSPLPRRRTCWR